MKKIFFEDKLTGHKQEFTLVNERNLPFLKSKVLGHFRLKTLVSIKLINL